MSGIIDISTSVQGTADDAAISKLSASSRGYYEDNFIVHFAGTSQRRMPLINRGYYSRVAAMDSVIERFLQGFQKSDRIVQIVSLGAGHDTTYFRLKQRGCLPHKFIELDLRKAVINKLNVFRSCKELRDVALHPFGTDKQNIQDSDLLEKLNQFIKTSQMYSGQVAFETGDYALGMVDICDVEAMNRVLSNLSWFRFDSPTLFLSECVLCYAYAEDSDALYRWINKTFSCVAVAEYQQILPFDRFGVTMVKNFERKGCPLRGIHTYPSPKELISRFKALKFGHAQVLDMKEIYYRYLDEGERQRIEKLEIFDEVEEWHLIQSHYCISIAASGLAMRDTSNKADNSVSIFFTESKCA